MGREIAALSTHVSHTGKNADVPLSLVHINLLTSNPYFLGLLDLLGISELLDELGL